MRTACCSSSRSVRDGCGGRDSSPLYKHELQTIILENTFRTKKVNDKLVSLFECVYMYTKCKRKRRGFIKLEIEIENDTTQTLMSRV